MKIKRFSLLIFVSFLIGAIFCIGFGDLYGLIAFFGSFPMLDKYLDLFTPYLGKKE